MPNESINDSDSIDELINAYDTLLVRFETIIPSKKTKQKAEARLIFRIFAPL